MTSAKLLGLIDSSGSSLDLDLTISTEELSKLQLASKGDIVTVKLVTKQKGLLLPQYAELGCFGLLITEVVAWSSKKNLGRDSFIWSLEAEDEITVEGTVRGALPIL